MSNEKQELNRRLRILKHAQESGNVNLTCRYFGIGRFAYYEWQAKFHGHVEDTGVRHVYIKPRSPQLNG
ncbi:MAG: hypothetical protein ACI9UK_002203 [Candidatus Krumholzibacteriia bacterium]|jgi:hypothetical protein